MNNLECAVSVLAGHREARAWTDNVVATDLLNQLGLDPKADAKNPKPTIDPLEAEVAVAEAEAHAATERAAKMRATLEAKTTGMAKPPVPPAPPLAPPTPPLVPTNIANTTKPESESGTQASNDTIDPRVPGLFEPGKVDAPPTPLAAVSDAEKVT